MIKTNSELENDYIEEQKDEGQESEIQPPLNKRAKTDYDSMSKSRLREICKLNGLY